jgi:hypothetical protein
MKPRFIVPALAVFTSLSASALDTTPASAHQTVYHPYYYPYATSNGATYSQETATCNTGYPDYDSSCVNGDYVSVRWWVRTRAQAEADIEYGEPWHVNLDQYYGHDDWWCHEVLYCNDGTIVDEGQYGTPCGWAVCPAGVRASKIEISFGIAIAS